MVADGMLNAQVPTLVSEACLEQAAETGVFDVVPLGLLKGNDPARKLVVVVGSGEELDGPGQLKDYYRPDLGIESDQMYGVFVKDKATDERKLVQVEGSVLRPQLPEAKFIDAKRVAGDVEKANTLTKFTFRTPFQAISLEDSMHDLGSNATANEQHNR